MINFMLLEKCNLDISPLFSLIKTGIPDFSINDFANSGIARYARYNFVIPGKTRYSCIKCGNCCKSLRSIGERILNGQDCPNLVNSKCDKYLTRYTACRTYPFHIIAPDERTDILVIDGNCNGFGNGAMLTIDSYKKIVCDLNRFYSTSDGIDIEFAQPIEL